MEILKMTKRFKASLLWGICMSSICVVILYFVQKGAEEITVASISLQWSVFFVTLFLMGYYSVYKDKS
jgi:hypothetical protein